MNVYFEVFCVKRIQNWGAKLICRAWKYNHATPLLQKSYWLPVERSNYLQMCRPHSPYYLSFCICMFCSPRPNLRSASDSIRLAVHSNIKVIKLLHSAECRSFSFTALRTWNALLANIRACKTFANLKKISKQTCTKLCMVTKQFVYN